MFRSAATPDPLPDADHPNTERTRTRHGLRGSPLLIGIVLKLATAISPSFLAGVALLTAEAHALGLPGWDTGDRLLFAAGYAIGNFLYLQAAMRFASHATNGARRRTLLLIRRGTGTAFAALGLALLLQVIVTR